MAKLATKVLITVASTLLCQAANVSANEYSGIKKIAESKELQTLREKYRGCVMAKASQYLQVNHIDSVIKHAPLACKRELLTVRQFLLSGAFKVEVVNELMESVQEGVEIDLVNHVYNSELKRKGIKP